MRKAVPLVPVLLSLLLVSGCARFRKPVDPEAAYRPLPPQIAEQIQPDRPFDHRPYEFILNERDQAHGPTVDFELLMGWTVTSEGAENAVLERSYERQLWGPHVGKVAWIGARDQISLTLRPPEALRVPDYFDTVTLWVRGGPGISDDPGAGSQLGVTVLIRGADGRSTPISLPTAETGGWTLLQHRLSEEERQRILHPCVIEGIKVEVHNAAEADSVFMDSLALYADRSPVLRFSPRPRPLTEMPFEENHTGKNPAKYLSFPVRKETIIPIRSSTESYTMLRQGDSGLYEFSCVAPDGDIRYWFNPDAGLSELTAEWNGKQVGKLLSGAGPLPVCPAGKTVLSRIEGESLRVEYDDGLSLRLSMEGKWLVIDIAGRSEKFSGFNFGKVQGLADARFVAMPSLSTRGGASGVLMGKSSASKAEHLFVGIWPDWTRSNGSELALRGDTEDTGENGSVRYLARTDGRRNRLSERLIVAVSPDALDVLPAIPNPRGMKAEMLSSRLWMQAHSADSYQEEVKRARELAAYGITNVIYNPGDWTWRDSGESRSLRTRAAPGK
ncbi:MAG: hypothetical protein KJ626_02880, partial [Verrucomicrobia bacterium]|nr:hypothetical protein [Verrucomicrobiota bacterium]